MLSAEKLAAQSPLGFKRLRQRQGRLITMDEDLGLPLQFAAKRLKTGELLIVATNGPAKNALNAYRRRWQIECLFGDSKTRGLNMEDTRLTLPKKLDTLLVIVTLSMTWTYACANSRQGQRRDQNQNPWLPGSVMVPSRI